MPNEPLPNLNTVSADDVVQLPAGSTYDVASRTGRIAIGVELLATGDLQYVDAAGATKLLTGLPAAYRPIRAKGIRPLTTVGVLLYF